VFERETTAPQRLAEGEGGAGDFPGNTQSGGESTDPFRFSSAERTVEPEDRAGQKSGQVSSGVGSGGSRIDADFVWRKISGGDHSRGGEAHPCDSLGEWEGRIR